MKFEDAFGKYIAESAVPDRECMHFEGRTYMHCGALHCFLCFSYHMKWQHACIYELDFDTGGPIVTGRLSVNVIVDTLLSGEEFDLDSVFMKLDASQQEHLRYCMANVDISHAKTTIQKEVRSTISNLDHLTDEQIAELAKLLERT